MSGNAHEMTSWRDGEGVIVPGGSYYDGYAGLECEYEFDQDPYSPGYETMGFRCCRDAD